MLGLRHLNTPTSVHVLLSPSPHDVFSSLPSWHLWYTFLLHCSLTENWDEHLDGTFVLCDHWRELYLAASSLPRDILCNIKPVHVEFWEVACKVGLWGLKGWRALLSIKDLLTKNLLAINRLINLSVNVSWIPTESSKAMIPAHKPTEHSVIFKAGICNSSFFHNFQCSEFYYSGPAPAQCV